MAAKSYETGYRKHLGDRLSNVSHDTTEEEIKNIYQDWASKYEKVGKRLFSSSKYTGLTQNRPGFLGVFYDRVNECQETLENLRYKGQ